MVANVEPVSILFHKLHGNKHVSPCYSLDARLASEMPLLFSSDNGRLGAALLGPCQKPRSMQCFYWLSIPQGPRFAFIASRQFASQAFIFSLNETGTRHSKHLYLVLMKQEQHMSVMLCDVRNDFRHSLLAFSSPKGR